MQLSEKESDLKHRNKNWMTKFLEMLANQRKVEIPLEEGFPIQVEEVSSQFD